MKKTSGKKVKKIKEFFQKEYVKGFDEDCAKIGLNPYKNPKNMPITKSMSGTRRINIMKGTVKFNDKSKPVSKNMDRMFNALRKQHGPAFEPITVAPEKPKEQLSDCCSERMIAISGAMGEPIYLCCGCQKEVNPDDSHKDKIYHPEEPKKWTPKLKAEAKALVLKRYSHDVKIAFTKFDNNELCIDVQWAGGGIWHTFDSLQKEIANQKDPVESRDKKIGKLKAGKGISSSFTYEPLESALIRFEHNQKELEQRFDEQDKWLQELDKFTSLMGKQVQKLEAKIDKLTKKKK